MTEPASDKQISEIRADLAKDDWTDYAVERLGYQMPAVLARLDRAEADRDELKDFLCSSSRLMSDLPEVRKRLNIPCNDKFVPGVIQRFEEVASERDKAKAERDAFALRVAILEEASEIGEMVPSAKLVETAKPSRTGAEAIVRRLAESEEPWVYDDLGGECGLCGTEDTHTVGCPWRQAVEYVSQSQTRVECPYCHAVQCSPGQGTRCCPDCSNHLPRSVEPITYAGPIPPCPCGSSGVYDFSDDFGEHLADATKGIEDRPSWLPDPKAAR